MILFAYILLLLSHRTYVLYVFLPSVSSTVYTPQSSITQAIYNYKYMINESDYVVLYLNIVYELCVYNFIAPSLYSTFVFNVWLFYYTHRRKSGRSGFFFFTDGSCVIYRCENRTSIIPDFFTNVFYTQLSGLEPYQILLHKGRADKTIAYSRIGISFDFFLHALWL